VTFAGGSLDGRVFAWDFVQGDADDIHGDDMFDTRMKMKDDGLYDE
jgi:hypothetical protein